MNHSTKSGLIDLCNLWSSFDILPATMWILNECVGVFFLGRIPQQMVRALVRPVPPVQPMPPVQRTGSDHRTISIGSVSKYIYHFVVSAFPCTYFLRLSFWILLTTNNTKTTNKKLFDHILKNEIQLVVHWSASNNRMLIGVCSTFLIYRRKKSSPPSIEASNLNIVFDMESFIFILRMKSNICANVDILLNQVTD